jgi:hypothetical protein
MKISKISLSVFIVMCLSGFAVAQSQGSATSLPLILNIERGVRVVDMSEKLTFDSTWYGNQSSLVKLRINDAEFAEGTGIGENVWEPRRPGMYTLSATTYQDGVIVGDVLSAQFEVVGRDLVNASVAFPDGMPLYDGTPRTPRVAVVYQGETLVEGQDYTLRYEDNISGVGKVVITGMGRFHDEIEKTFKIQPAGKCTLDICSGIRKANFPEKITYDENWFSSTGAGYIRIMENGTRVAQENGAGEYSWTATEGGLYTLTHSTYIDGYLQNDKIYTATFIVEDIPVLKNVVASQRYPWNGLVDVKCVLEGDGARDYKVTLAVKDETGGTNLPARTFWQNGGTVTNSVQIVRPGNLHFVWDANADIAEDGEFPALSVTLKAESSAVPSYTGVVAIEENGYQGVETLTDVPVLVRLGLDTEGFSYSGMAFPDTGADLRFMDWDEKNVLPYEIDEWHNGGESLVWVKLPELKKGTRFKMFYGGAAVSSMNETTHRMGYRGEAVWSDYAGVWHMNEDSGMAYDSTAHGLDALPESSGSTIDEMVSNAAGACGRSRYNAKTANDNRMRIPSYDALTLGSHFVASGWFRVESISGYPKLFFRNFSEWAGGGWGIETTKNDPTQLTVVGSSSGPSPYLKNVAISDLR